MRGVLGWESSGGGKPARRRAALAANSRVGMERFDFVRMVEQTAQTLERVRSRGAM